MSPHVVFRDILASTETLKAKVADRSTLWRIAKSGDLIVTIWVIVHCINRPISLNKGTMIRVLSPLSGQRNCSIFVSMNVPCSNYHFCAIITVRLFFCSLYNRVFLRITFFGGGGGDIIYVNLSQGACACNFRNFFLIIFCPSFYYPWSYLIAIFCSSFEPCIFWMNTLITILSTSFVLQQTSIT